MASPRPYAYFRDRWATDLIEVSHDPAVLDTQGWWAVVMTYEGEFTGARFADVRTTAHPRATWRAVAPDSWSSSMSQDVYVEAVELVRAAIASGEVYQANVCRVLSAALPRAADLTGLAWLLQAHHPASHSGTVLLPEHGLQVVSASPELFLQRRERTLTSSPIKGTAKTAEGLLVKDSAENVMIVDLVRNDLGIVCQTGSISVPSLLALESFPGLVHLVSTVQGTLADGYGWPDILKATFPPGSVTGAPKSSALRIIDAVERAPRGPYCGAIGWVDADAAAAELAVGIRTFWAVDDVLHFGTGAGITWGSDPLREWDETTLKAERLLEVAGRAST
ncbi:MAG TPA: chorismate-binding protein [Actinomycetes bacterium]|nr:chorismate-binding protein [Actinomycetes bacterium]